MPGRIAEVDASPTVIGIDLAGQGLLRIGPVFDATGEHALVNRVEAAVVNEECIVLHLNVGDIRLGELDKRVMIERYDRERPLERWFWESEEFREE
jgi:hypothetical protein